MGEKALWPAVAIAGMVSATVCVLLLNGVEVVSIIAVFSIAGNLISLMLYGKLQKVETQTNGMMSNQQVMVRDLVDYIKTSTPTPASSDKE